MTPRPPPRQLSVDSLYFDRANQDILLSRLAANILGLGAGDSFRIPSDGQLQVGAGIALDEGSLGSIGHAVALTSLDATRPFSLLQLFPLNLTTSDRAEVTVEGLTEASLLAGNVERLFIEETDTAHYIAVEKLGAGINKNLAIGVYGRTVDSPGAGSYENAALLTISAATLRWNFYSTDYFVFNCLTANSPGQVYIEATGSPAGAQALLSLVRPGGRQILLVLEDAEHYLAINAGAQTLLPFKFLMGGSEVARLATAADPYFSMGGSQQHKFLNSGAIGFFSVSPASQQAHIINADGTLADITTKFNNLLLKLETYGLLASV